MQSILHQQDLRPRLPIINRVKQLIRDEHPLVLPVITFLCLFFLSLIIFVSLGATTIDASDSRVVRLSINGRQQVLPTRAETVGDLLGRMNIELTEKDIVEPELDTVISEDNFSVNVYKARPVTIVDEGKQVTTVTAEPTPRAAAEAAGLKVYPEDKVEKKVATESSNPVTIMRDGMGTEQVVIDRATPISVNLYGNAINARTHAETVADVLKEKNIQTLEGDVISPSPETPLSEVKGIFIVRIGSQIVTVEEEVEPPTETITDASVAAGQTVVKQAGSKGKKLVTYEIQLENDKEVSRKPLQEVIAVEPVKRVVAKGSKIVPRAVSGASAAENREMGRQIAASMGYSHEFDCIDYIYSRESRWNHLARNTSSGAYGIPQALPGSKMGPGWESDPAVQIRWGIGYMVGRYGSPCKAYNFWVVNHWY